MTSVRMPPELVTKIQRRRPGEFDEYFEEVTNYLLVNFEILKAAARRGARRRRLVDHEELLQELWQVTLEQLHVWALGRPAKEVELLLSMPIDEWADELTGSRIGRNLQRKEIRFRTPTGTREPTSPAAEVELKKLIERVLAAVDEHEADAFRRKHGLPPWAIRQNVQTIALETGVSTRTVRRRVENVDHAVRRIAAGD